MKQQKGNRNDWVENFNLKANKFEWLEIKI